MIRPDKYDKALRALNFILTRARYLAFEGQSEQVAKLLDSAEILPKYIAEESDSTDLYRTTLEGIATDHPICSHVIKEFDQEQKSDW